MSQYKRHKKQYIQSDLFPEEIFTIVYYNYRYTKDGYKDRSNPVTWSEPITESKYNEWIKYNIITKQHKLIK